MAIKYYKLMNLLNVRGISKKQLQEMAGFSSKTVAKLSANKNVTTDILDRVCMALDVQPADIMEHMPND